MDEWIEVYEEACPGTKIDYRPVGSSTGRQQFIDGRTSFGGSDSALEEQGDQKAKANANARCAGGEAVDLPMVIGPVAVVYNLPGIDGLRLSPSNLAKIFSGAIASWNDPAIAADNTGAALPDAAIISVHRSDGSGTTDNFTKFLGGAAGSEWSFGSGSGWKAPGGQGAEGSEGVTSTVKSTPHSIGYVELAYAANARLHTARVKNAAGEFVDVGANAASIGVGSAKIGEGDELKLTFDYTTATSGAYPIYLVTYEIACTKGLPADQAALVKAFLAYTASKAGQDAISDLGHAPLPNAVAERVRGVVAKLA
jgi:phosphate transport system substrate-binding protein